MDPCTIRNNMDPCTIRNNMDLVLLGTGSVCSHHLRVLVLVGKEMKTVSSYS